MFETPLIMGIVNVTPDSFSDGGLYVAPDLAIAHGQRLIAEGATLIDIGGESTRPGSIPVTPDQEIARILPVLDGLRGKGAALSVDTRHAKTMRAALEHGADMINDVTALQGDPESLEVVAKAGVPVCLMHMQGTPETMQTNPLYGDVVQDVLSFLLHQANLCLKAGLAKEKIFIDPGIGFGKTRAHNLDLLRNLENFVVSGFPVVLGASRKSFIEKIMEHEVPPMERLGGSLASVLRGVDAGVRIVRVHDVAATRQAMAVWQAMKLP